MGRTLFYFHPASIQSGRPGLLSREQRVLGGDRNLLSGVYFTGKTICSLDANGIGRITSFETFVDQGK